MANPAMAAMEKKLSGKMPKMGKKMKGKS